MYIKRNVIAQIQKDYGYNYKQAEDFYNKIDDECRAEFDAEYYAEARKSFYEDWQMPIEAIIIIIVMYCILIYH